MNMNIIWFRFKDTSSCAENRLGKRWNVTEYFTFKPGWGLWDERAFWIHTAYVQSTSRHLFSIIPIFPENTQKWSALCYSGVEPSCAGLFKRCRVALTQPQVACVYTHSVAVNRRPPFSRNARIDILLRLYTAPLWTNYGVNYYTTRGADRALYTLAYCVLHRKLHRFFHIGLITLGHQTQSRNLGGGGGEGLVGTGGTCPPGLPHFEMTIFVCLINCQYRLSTVTIVTIGH